MSEEKESNIFQIMHSLLVYIILGFILVFCLLMGLYTMVKLIIYFAV